MGIKSNVEEKFTIKTNKIFIGDICYALDDEIYDNVWCDELGCKDGLIKVENKVVAAVGGTAHGDGLYYSADEREFPVDAGVIGIVDLNYSNTKNLSRLERLGVIVDIPNGECTVKFSAYNGVFDIEIFEEDADYNREEIFKIHINTYEDADEDEDDW